MANRREFLHVSAAAMVAAAWPPFTQPAQPSAAGWYERPMRWAQLTLVEDDPGRYDPQFWLDYFKRTHSDAACLSAGGCVAYYPTNVPFHHRSRSLGDRDAFGELVAGCRALGMNVIARTDPHAAHQDVHDAHPDWIAVDADGRRRKHWADPELWVTCALGPYNFEFMAAVTREIVSRYKVDGIFSNRWSGSGMCYCEHCQGNFRRFSGLDLPRTSNPQDPARRQYLVWHQQRLFELWRLWDAEIKAINPAASYIANAGGGALSGLDMKIIGELAPTLFADRQARRGVMPPWSNGKNGKEYTATMGTKAIGGIFSMGVEEPYRWKDSVQHPEEVRLWAIDGIAHNLRPWFTKFNGKVVDRRWMQAVEDLYVWHWRNDRYLRNTQSLARVAMVYSQQTASYYGGDRAQARVEDHALGFYHALVQARVPFDMVHDQLLDASHVSRYRTLILPNIAALSEAQCRQIADFVRAGGSIVATHETSLYDEWGVRRADFGLAALFGASFTGKADTNVHNSYLNIEKNAAGRFHPLVFGLEEAGRIINGVHWLHTRPTQTGYAAPLTLLPSFPDLPMESVYPRVAHTDVPGAYVREEGAGRVVYFPFDIDRTFWEVLSPDHSLLLRNAVRWACNEEQPLVVEGKGVFDVSLWMQERSIAAHLVNLTNPMMMKGPVQEVIPSPPQKVRIQVPPGRKVTKVSLLVSEKPAGAKIAGQVVTLDLPSIDLHEVIALDLE
jgi:hypothetical protein